MADPRTTGARRQARVSREQAVRGFHPVFGPVTDPGPDDIGGGWDGWPIFGGWHGGPVADPGPIFGGWRGTLMATVERSALDAVTVKQAAGLRIRRIEVAIRALEEQVAIQDEEFKLLSRSSGSLRLDRSRLPPIIGPGDPPLEIRPIDYVRFIHDVRSAVQRRTITFLKDAARTLLAQK